MSQPDQPLRLRMWEHTSSMLWFRFTRPPTQEEAARLSAALFAALPESAPKGDAA